MSKSPRLLYVVNVDWFFVSHRLPLALAAKEAGYDVWVAAADTGAGKTIESHGLRFISMPMSRSGTRLTAEVKVLFLLLKLYWQVRPVLVHHVSIKPVIYGSLISRLFPNMAVVNAVTGMGYVFSGDKKASKIKQLVIAAYRIAFGKRKLRVIFQNEMDRTTFIGNNLVAAHKSILIRGSGVDCNVFKPSEGKSGLQKDPVVLLASRMIWDKGIAEFAEAATIVKKHLPSVRFVLAGQVDTGNPNSVPQDQLLLWQRAGTLTWIGHQDDMQTVLMGADIVVLPSFYPEGVPKVLIEAAAAGKPIIATNRPGCNDIVRDGINGILIPERDGNKLAAAIFQLLQSPETMERMGKAGRVLALEEFNISGVINSTLSIYKELLTFPPPR